MDSKQTKKIAKTIAAEIKKTTESIFEYKKMCKPISPDDAIGRVSRMDAINNKSVLESALRKAENRLKKLKLVQKEILNKDFGMCIRCKKEIPLARLALVPESKKCVHCA